ncbi:Transcription initiation factor IIA subunit 2 [Hibiscus syriacus]|uniref:Transcription initiation factor IIA subunit 2 n=1 Tax=Hibiscus syriacus TaxID=106335 RepID=A0A6A2Z7Y6_HIBSY|nr:Transcription initiation factor IIA subunit 2 [Hibiscus syriacus]
MATFELYWRSTIGMCLTETLDEMVSSSTLSQVLVQFDKSMTEALESRVKRKVSIKGSKSSLGINCNGSRVAYMVPDCGSNRLLFIFNMLALHLWEYWLAAHMIASSFALSYGIYFFMLESCSSEIHLQHLDTHTPLMEMSMFHGSLISKMFSRISVDDLKCRVNTS